MNLLYIIYRLTTKLYTCRYSTLVDTQHLSILNTCRYSTLVVE